MEKLSAEIAEKINQNKDYLLDETRLIKVTVSLSHPEYTDIGISDEWRSFASELSRDEISIIKSSLTVARNYLRIPTIGYLRRTPMEELAKGQKIGPNRLKILKAFGDNPEQPMKLSDFIESSEDIYFKDL